MDLLKSVLGFIACKAQPLFELVTDVVVTMGTGLYVAFAGAGAYATLVAPLEVLFAFDLAPATVDIFY